MDKSYQDIVWQHIEEGAFLWHLRRRMYHQPNVMAADLAEISGRINAHIDRLLCSLEFTWEILTEEADLKDAGYLFVATSLALRSLETEKVRLCIEAFLQNKAQLDEVASSLCGVDDAISSPWVKKFLKSKDLNHKWLAMRVCSLKLLDTGQLLDKFLARKDCLGHDRLYSESLIHCGLFGRRDLLLNHTVAYEAENELLQFISLEAGLRCGEETAVKVLAKKLCAEPGPSLDLIKLAARKFEPSLVKNAVFSMLAKSGQERKAIQIISILGDVQAMPWLIRQMGVPEHAKIAGEAFATITGWQIGESEFELAVPPLPLELDLEDAESSEHADDEHLPWPDAEKLGIAWKTYGGKFQSGIRYFLGCAVEQQDWPSCLSHSYQRHRLYAFEELLLRGILPQSNPLVG